MTLMLSVSDTANRKEIDRPSAWAASLPHPPLRVALFTGNYNHIADGVSLTLNRLVAFLERQGIAVRIVAPTIDEPRVDHAGTLLAVPSIPMPGRSEYRISTHLPASVREELEAFQPTLFHIATPDVIGLQALRLAKQWDVPVVASYHTHFSSYLKYYGVLAPFEKLMWKFLRWFYQQCTHTYVPSPSMAEVLESHGITDGLKLWPRGVETHRFNPDKRSRSWRQAIGVADDDVVVTFVGRLVLEKSPDVFADVIETLKKRGLRFRTMIVGDGPERATLEAKLPNAIFTGHLEGEALSRAYASSDVFLFPSETETFGNVTLEAMASGLPTVCANATGSASLVEHGETGFLAEPRNVEAFVPYVEQLITDADLRHAMGQCALERAQTFDWNAILERLLCNYYDVIGVEVETAGDGLSAPRCGDGHALAEPVFQVSSLTE